MGLRKITGIAGGCARVEIGQTATPPSRVMNSRRVIRLARRRATETIPGS